MQAIYMSDSFVVVQMQSAVQQAVQQAADAPVVSNQAAQATGTHPALTRLGFEIVDRRHGREVYLDGAWAELFAQQLQAWQRQSPTQEEVEDTLDRYAALAHTPIALH